MQEHSPDALFGELRSILHQVPSSRRWELFCHVIEPWESLHARRDDVLCYAESFLHRWPSQYRRPPARWLDRQIVAMTEHSPFWLWPVVRMLDLHETTPLLPSHLNTSLLAHITQLSLSGSRAHLFLHKLTLLPTLPLTHLTVERWPLSAARLLTHLRKLDAPQLGALRLTHARHTVGSVDALCQLPWIHQVRLLDLSYNFLDDRALDLLLDAPPARLEHLDLTGNKLSERGIKRLLNHTFTRQLYTLSLGDNLDLSPALCARLLDP